MIENNPTLKKTLLALVRSRKVWMAFFGLLNAAGAKWGLNIDNELVAAILGFHGVVILAMAHEDAAEKKDVPPP